MREKVLAVIRREVQPPPANLSESTPMEALNIDSLEFLDLLVSIGSEIGSDIPDNRIDELKTVGDLIRIAEEVSTPA